MEETLPGPSTAVDKKMDYELTNKFLSGEMSFAEYSSEWYQGEPDDVDDSDESGAEDTREQSAQSKDIKRRRRRGTHLKPALLGLMGEANLRFVRGDKEMAEKMCREIIKEVPTAAEPYQTLAQIYEEDPEKSLQFSLIAAHLNPSDANEWLRLANVAKERQDVRQEMICYSQAIAADPHNIDLHMKRLELVTKLEDNKNSISSLNITRVKCYHRIVTSLPSSQGDIILKYARMAAKIYHKNNEIEKTQNVMSAAYKKCSEIFTVEDINILLELLIANKQYQTCLDIFVAHLGIEIEAEIQTVKNSDGEIEEQTNYLNCTIPDNLQIDLRCKLLVCFIYLNAINMVQTLLQDFLSNDVEKAGDLYMDVEEALSAVGLHDFAIKLLEPLVNNTSFDLGAVWLKHAECLHNLGREEDAIQSYYKVLKHVPQHPEARRKLFTILEKKGSIDQALDILNQDYRYVVSAKLLQEQCTVLKKYDKMEEYLKVGEALLSKTFGRYRNAAEIQIAYRTRGGLEYIHNFRTTRGENPYNEDDIHFDEDEDFHFSPAEEWSFFRELLEIALKKKMYTTMQRLTFGALISKNLTPRRTALEFLCFQSCLLNNDFENCMRFVREYCYKYPGTKSHNLLNFVFNSVVDGAHLKYLQRLFMKDKTPYKRLLLGCNFFNSARNLVGLKYFLDYHEECEDALSALLIGITSLVMAAQKLVDKHNNLILQGISYMLKYKKLRKCDHEVNYNLGRAYQGLTINNLAIEYYERVLNSDSITECKEHGVIDLKKETAFNLCILYSKHSPVMAQKYLREYLVIE